MAGLSALTSLSLGSTKNAHKRSTCCKAACLAFGKPQGDHRYMLKRRVRR
jgi:hypothetical protein